MSQVADQLSEILSNLQINAGVFYAGKVCGMHDYGGSTQREGHIHIVKSGRIRLSSRTIESQVVEAPVAVFFPTPDKHSLIADASDNAELICATIRYGVGSNNPLAQTLPHCIRIPLNSDSLAWNTVNSMLIQREGALLPGAQFILDRLMDVFLAIAIQQLLQSGDANLGLLSGLSHPRLSRALIAMHQSPSTRWNLQILAEHANMSRSVFAQTFKDVVGLSPLEYLTQWRISMSKNMLMQGKSITFAAAEVGYESASAFSKAFKKEESYSPRQWLQAAS